MASLVHAAGCRAGSNPQLCLQRLHIPQVRKHLLGCWPPTSNAVKQSFSGACQWLQQMDFQKYEERNMPTKEQIPVSNQVSEENLLELFNIEKITYPVVHVPQ